MASSNDERWKQTRLHSKHLKKMKKEGVSIKCISETAHGVVMEGLPVPPGVPPHFELKQRALLAFRDGPSLHPQKRGNMKGEKQYRDYYDDIVAFESEWMTFFSHPENCDHAEHTCGILGTLATVYRQRGTLDECEKVLDMEDKVLNIYERHAKERGTVYAKCFSELKYKYQHIRYNMCFQLQRYDDNVLIFRDLLDFEYRHNLPFDDQQYLFMVPLVVRKKPTAKVIKKLTDEEIMMMVLAPVRQAGSDAPSIDPEGTKEKVALHKCENCDVEERAMAMFKKCSGCRGVYYCGKDCQRRHWKMHKRNCEARRKN